MPRTRLKVQDGEIFELYSVDNTYRASFRVDTNGIVRFANLSGISFDNKVNVDATTTFNGTINAFSGNSLFGATGTPLFPVHVRATASPRIVAEDTTNTVRAVMNADNEAAIFGSLSPHRIDFSLNSEIKMQISRSGSVVIGNGLNALANEGFLHIPLISGTPLGTPTNYTGTAAMVFNQNSNSLYIYNPTGGWVSVVLS
jgi:hypothetical protein